MKNVQMDMFTETVKFVRVSFVSEGAPIAGQPNKFHSLRESGLVNFTM